MLCPSASGLEGCALTLRVPSMMLRRWRRRIARTRERVVVAAAVTGADLVEEERRPSVLPVVATQLALIDGAEALKNVLEVSLSAGQLSPQLIIAAWAWLQSRRRAAGVRRSPYARATLLRRLAELTAQQLGCLSDDEVGAVARAASLTGAAALAPELLDAIDMRACAWAPAPAAPSSGSGSGSGTSCCSSAAGFADLMWTLAHLRRQPSAALAAHVAALLQRPETNWRSWFAGADARAALRLLWALARLRCEPSPQLLDAAAVRLPPPALGRMHSASLVALACALAELGAAHEELSGLLKSISLELARRVEAQLLDARAAPPPARPRRQQQGHAPAPQRCGGSGGGGDGALSARLLGRLLWACGALRHRHERLLRLAARALHAQLAAAGPADLASALWGLGRLGYCPPELLADACELLGGGGGGGSGGGGPGLLALLDARQLAMVVSAFAALDYFPGRKTSWAGGLSTLRGDRSFSHLRPPLPPPPTPRAPQASAAWMRWPAPAGPPALVWTRLRWRSCSGACPGWAWWMGPGTRRGGRAAAGCEGGRRRRGRRQLCPLLPPGGHHARAHHCLAHALTVRPGCLS